MAKLKTIWPKAVLIGVSLIAIGVGYRVVTTTDEAGGGVPGGSTPGSSGQANKGKGGSPGTGTATQLPGGVGSGSPRPTPSSPLPPDWAFGTYDKISPDDPTPNGCRLKRGEPCFLSFNVRWNLTTLESAAVRVAAFENGEPRPVSHMDIPIKKGSSRGFQGLQYVPSADAETVVFKVQLIDTSGKIIHEIDPPPPTLVVRP